MIGFVRRQEGRGVNVQRQQIADGKSDQQVLDFLVERYGDAILMKPPLQSDT